MNEAGAARQRRVAYLVERSSWLDGNRVVSSLRDRFQTLVTWAVLTSDRPRNEPFATKRQLVLAEARNLAKLGCTPAFYRGRWLFVCMSGHYSCLAFALLLRALRRDPKVYLCNFSLHELGTNRLVRATLRALLNTHVRILCQARDELRYFGELRPVLRLDYSPYCQGPLMNPDWIGSGGYVFAGGYTNRDYDLLVRCAARLPEQRFVIACSSLNRISLALPPNVEIVRDSDWASFHSLLGHSKLVVVPLREHVGSSGQMVTLAAMEAGKPTVVPDVDSVSQYVTDGVSGFLYTLGDERSLGDRLGWCLEHAESLARAGEAARSSYHEHYVRERFDDAVLSGVVAHAAG
jgi:Glycosyl transferases group 1